MIATLDYKGFITDSDLTLPVISNNEIGNTGIVYEFNNNFLNFSPGDQTPKEEALEQGTVYQTHKVKKDVIYS